MHKFFRDIKSYLLPDTPQDTAEKILYLCRDKKAMRSDLPIRDFDNVRNVLASVIAGSIDHAAYFRLPQEMQEQIINTIADKLVEVADNHVGIHPDRAFGTPGTVKGKGIDYETNVEYLNENILFGSGPSSERNCQVAISFSPTLFANRLKLQEALHDIFQQIQGAYLLPKEIKAAISAP